MSRIDLEHLTDGTSAEHKSLETRCDGLIQESLDVIFGDVDKVGGKIKWRSQCLNKFVGYIQDGSGLGNVSGRTIIAVVEEDIRSVGNSQIHWSCWGGKEVEVTAECGVRICV